MKFFIPILCSIFMRCGGWGIDDNFAPIIPIKQPKNAIIRFFVGRLREYGISALMWAYTGNWMVFLAYLGALSIPYGDNKNNWLRKLVGRDINWLIYGGCLGACSFLSLSLGLSLIAVLLGASSFWFLMVWSNDGIHTGWDIKHGVRPMIEKRWFLNHAYVELGIGFLGTVLYWFK